MKKIILLMVAICFSHSSHSEVNESILGKKENYPSNCEYPKSNYIKCLVSWFSANDPSPSPMVRRIIKNGEEVRELSLDPSIDPGMKSKLDDTFKRTPLMAMLVVKNGKLIYENYQYDRKPSDTLMYMSMTKSLVALSIGKAIELGNIKSVDDTVSQYLPELSSSSYANITIKNLLQMTSGVGYKYDPYGYDSDTNRLTLVTNGYSEKFSSLTDYLNSFKPSNQNSEQGKSFNYDNNNTNILAMIIKSATKQPLNEFFSEQIWSKIGAASAGSWQGNKNGDLMAHAGFHSTPKDLARLGLVLLNEGKYRDKQIISKSWIDTQFSPLVKSRILKGGEFYGYQTWVLDNKGQQFAFEGNLGQSMMIDKSSNTILVTFGVDLKNEFWPDIFKTFAYVSK
jgi:CubicO group peptidase (beta-lactamase class C family)